MNIQPSNPTHQLCSDPKINGIAQFVKSGQDINKKTDINHETALHIAAKHNYASSIKYLIEANADVNARDRKNNTPLHLALLRHAPCIQTIKYLVDHGAMINSVNNEGSTPLHLAVNKNSIQIAKYLIELGAPVNPVDSYGRTPLHIAAIVNYDSDISMIQYLVESGAFIDAKDGFGNTPLHLASEYESTLDAVKYLLDHGADKHIVNKDGLTAAKYCIRPVVFDGEEYERFNTNAAFIETYEPVLTKGVHCG